ncbi:hypothetical protein BDW67DRAFT_181482 [Aspergillus spinulosporus]
MHDRAERQHHGRDNGRFDGGSNHCYVSDNTAPREISSQLSEEHIITGRKRRESRRPARLIRGERDIPLLDEYRLNKRPRKSPEQKEREKINVTVGSPDLACDSDDSPLTDLEDLSVGSCDLDSGYQLSEHPAEDETNVANEKEHSLDNECTACAEKIINLRHEVQQVLLSKTSELAALRKENISLRRELERAQKLHSASAMDEDIANKLLEREDEVKSLRRRLLSALEYNELTRPVETYDDTYVTSTGFVHQGMVTLGNYVVYAAYLLDCIRNPNTSTDNQDTVQLIEKTIRTIDLLSSDPCSAFRALLFGFIQEHVFKAPQIWRNLHFDGIMLRQYQRILERIISPEALERHHRAALCYTLTRTPEFKDTFLAGYAEQLQFELLRILSPIIRQTDVNAQLRRQLRTLFRHALYLRARCYPCTGTRYQLLQFRPGDIYDSRVMRAENEVGAIVDVPNDGVQRRIKVCVHGLMKGLQVQETLSGSELIQSLSQPFILEDERTDGKVISDRAAVILE